MILLTSCTTTYKLKTLETKVAKLIEISDELLEVPPEPAPVFLQPHNCPVVLDQYMNIYDDLALKFGLIRKAQQEIIGDRK